MIPNTPPQQSGKRVFFRGIPSLFLVGVCNSLRTALIGLKKSCPMLVKLYNFLGFAETSFHKTNRKIWETIKMVYVGQWGYIRVLPDGRRHCSFQGCINYTTYRLSEKFGALPQQPIGYGPHALDGLILLRVSQCATLTPLGGALSPLPISSAKNPKGDQFLSGVF